MPTYDETIARLAALAAEAERIAGPSITPPAVAAAIASVPEGTDEDD